MSDYLRSKVYDDSKVDDLSQQNGQVDSLPVFNLEMDDRDIISALHNNIEDSRGYWDDPKSHNLKEARNETVKLWIGKQVDTSKLYRHNIPYVDNRIFTAVETIISHVTSRIARAEVYPAQGTEVSKILAEDLEKVMVAHSERQQMDKKAKAATRNLLLKRIGLLKLRFDSNVGKSGDIVVDVINPENVIVDKNVKESENPRFICEMMTASVQELCNKFPDSKDKIMEECGYKRGTTKQMQQIIAYREVWFTYYDDSNKQQEGVVWYFGKCVLGKMKNPNWNYSAGKKNMNFLDTPLKPYIPFNYINDGAHWIDNTSAVEQAAPLQHIANRRGRQIMENADKANPVKVFAADAMTAEDAENLTGNPNQSIIVKGSDVNKAVTTVQAQLLPQYVVESLYDARNEIDTILGTPNAFRGEETNNNTLGQDVMIRNQAVGRQDDLVRAIDHAMGQYYKYLVQMMKVYFTEDHFYTVAGEDGEFDYIVMKSDKIEDGIDVRVEAGSTLPFDKERAEAVALNLAKSGLIDPLSLYEDLRLPNARKRFERLIKFQVDPTLLAEDIKKEEADRDAYMDYTILMAGKPAEPREEVTEEHLASHRKQMQTAEFLNAKPEIKQMMITHVTMEVENLRKVLLAMETQLPTDQEIQAGNQQMLDQAQQQSQYNQATAPQLPPQPGKGGPMTGMNAGTPSSTPGNPSNPSQLPTV